MSAMTVVLLVIAAIDCVMIFWALRVNGYLGRNGRRDGRGRGGRR